MALLFKEKSILDKILAKINTQNFVMEQLKFPKLSLPTLKPKHKLTVAEKFQLLCPVWYRVITAKSEKKAEKIKTKNCVRYSDGSRCFIGEVNGFSDGYHRRYSDGGNYCTGCSELAHNDSLRGLADEFGLIDDNINHDYRIINLVKHVEEVHPHLLR